MRTRLEKVVRLGLLLVLVWGAWGCSNFVVHHRSNTKHSIHVYVNWKRVCVVKQGESCRLRMKPGRYTFYAMVPGKPNFKWSSVQRPTVFVIDKETVVVLGAKPKQGNTRMEPVRGTVSGSSFRQTHQ
jgi:hypothetical protein